MSGVVYKYRGKMPDRPPTATPWRRRCFCRAVRRPIPTLPGARAASDARHAGGGCALWRTAAGRLHDRAGAGAANQPRPVRLASADWRDAPIIDGNHLGTDHDLRHRACDRGSAGAGPSTALDAVRDAELIPGPKATADDIRELARPASASFGHPVGTCKIGVDDAAVVDPQLRVQDFRLACRRCLGDAGSFRADECADAHDRGPRRAADSRPKCLNSRALSEGRR